MQRRAAEPAVEHGATEARAREHGTARLLRYDRRANRAHRKARRAELQRAHLQIIEADHRAGRAEGEASRVADAPGDRKPERTHSAVRERTIQLRDRAEGSRSAGPRSEADGSHGQPRSVRRVRGDLRHAAHRSARTRLSQRKAPAGQTAAAHLDVPIDPKRVGRPVECDTAPPGYVRPRAARTDYVGA